MRAPPSQPGSEVIWHEAECGSYRADLEIWARLAAEAGREIVDLGAGTGRVSLQLAARGHRVVAVDCDERLLEALRMRARERGLEGIRTVGADLRDLTLDRDHRLAIAPMQLFHLLGGPAGRARALAAVAAFLRPRGRLYAALLDDSRPLSSGTPDPLPDVREVDGWVHSSLPLDVRLNQGALQVSRLRQLVSPSGELSEEREVIALDLLGPAQLESEAAEAGFAPLPRIRVAETDDHVGSIIVGLQAPE